MVCYHELFCFRTGWTQLIPVRKHVVLLCRHNVQRNQLHRCCQYWKKGWNCLAGSLELTRKYYFQSVRDINRYTDCLDNHSNLLLKRWINIKNIFLFQYLLDRLLSCFSTSSDCKHFTYPADRIPSGSGHYLLCNDYKTKKIQKRGTHFLDCWNQHLAYCNFSWKFSQLVCFADVGHLPGL